MDIREELTRKNEERRQQRNEGIAPVAGDPDYVPENRVPTNEGGYSAKGFGKSGEEISAEKDIADKAELSRKTYGYNDVAEQDAMPEVEWTDANKQEFLQQSLKAGRSLQQMKDQVRDSWGEPLEVSIARAAKQNGGDVDKVLEAFGADVADIKKGTNRASRYAMGVSGLFAEVLEGVGLGEYDGMWDESDGTSIDTIARRDKMEAIYQMKEGNLESDGTVNTAFNISGGVGEAMPYLATGIGSSIVKAVPVMGQLIADFALSQGIDTARLNSSKGDIEQYGWNTAANVVGFGIGKVLSPASQKGLIALEKRVNGIGEDNVAAILNGMNEADKAGVDVLSSDIDPTTALAQIMKAMEKNPATAHALQTVTEKDVKTLIDYVSTVKAEMSEHLGGNQQTADLVLNTLKAKEAKLTTEINTAYDALGNIQNGSTASLDNASFLRWTDGILAKITNEDIVQGTDINFIKNYMTELRAVKANNGRSVGLQDMYEMMRSVIGKASEATNGSESRAFAKLAEVFEAQFGAMTPPGMSGQMGDVINQAKSLYKRRLDQFGYRNSGRGAETPFLPTFIKKLEENSENAMKLVKTAEHVKQLREHLGDSIMDVIKRNKLENLVSASKSNDKFDLLAFSRQIDKQDPGLMRELYGDQYESIKGLGKVANWVGKRHKALSNPNILGTQGMLKSFTTGGISGAINGIKHVLGAIMGGRGLVKKSIREASSLKADFIKQLGMDPADFMRTLPDIAIKPEVRMGASETFHAPEGIPNQQQVALATEGRNSGNAPLDNGLTPRQLEREANRSYNLSLQTGQRELRLRGGGEKRQKLVEEIAVVRRDLAVARQANDIQGINNATKAMEDITERIRELPKRGNEPTPPNGGGGPAPITAREEALIAKNDTIRTELETARNELEAGVAGSQAKIDKLRAKLNAAEELAAEKTEQLAAREVEQGSVNNVAPAVRDLSSGRLADPAGRLTRNISGDTILTPADDVSRSTLDNFVTEYMNAGETLVVSRRVGSPLIINPTDTMTTQAGIRRAILDEFAPEASSRGRLLDNGAVVMPNAGRVELNPDTGAISLTMSEGTRDGLVTASRKLMKEYSSMEVRSATGTHYARLDSTMSKADIEARIDQLVDNIGNGFRTQGEAVPRIPREVNHSDMGSIEFAVTNRQTINYGNGAKAIYNNGGYEIHTNMSTNTNKATQIAEELLEQMDDVTMISSAGTTSKNINVNSISEDIANFMEEAANQRNRATTPMNSSSGRASTVRQDSRSTNFADRTETATKEATDAISPQLRRGETQQLDGVGKVSYTTEKTKRYSDRGYSNKVVLELRQRGLDKAKAFQMIDEFVNGGQIANQGRSLDVRYGGKGFTFNPDSSVAHRLKAMGLDLPEGVSVTPRSTPIRGRAEFSAEPQLAKEGVAERLNEIVSKKLGFKAQVSGNGGAITVKDINGNNRGHFSIDRDGVLHGTTTDLTRGSGEGQRIYQGLWDALEGSGMKYQASGGLSSINKWSMTASMIDYMAKRGGRDAPHVGINSVQHGATYELNNEVLTHTNAMKLMDNFKDELKAISTEGSRSADVRALSADMTDGELKKMAMRLGKNDKYRLGLNTLKMVRRFLQSNDLKSYSLSLAALVASTEFMSYIDKEGGESL